jgi:hypothetical protein
MKMIGEPDAGNPHVRFDEGVQETWFTRRACALLYQRPRIKTKSTFRMELAQFVAAVLVRQLRGPNLSTCP